MIINAGQILGLPVYTRGGVLLGKVYDLEINQENYTLACLLVRKNVLVSSPLFIAIGQVVKFEADKIIVEDLTVEQAEPEIKTAF